MLTLSKILAQKIGNNHYIAISIIYTFKKTKLDAQYKAKDLKIMKAYKSKEKTKLNLYKEFIQTNTLTSSNYKKLSPNKYYIEYAIFKLDENNTRIYEEVFYSKIIALHLKCFM